MDKCEYSIYSLPDIEMYGGDTTPWEIRIKSIDGKTYSLNDLSGYTCVLSVMPFTTITGRVNTPTGMSPIITKNGIIGSSDDGYHTRFEFVSSDTIMMHGKYVYQIELTAGADRFVSQGNLYIRQNIRRG